MRENQQRRLRRKHLYGDISTNQVKSLLPRPVLSPPHHSIERARGRCCPERKELKRKEKRQPQMHCWKFSAWADSNFGGGEALTGWKIRTTGLLDLSRFFIHLKVVGKPEGTAWTFLGSRKNWSKENVQNSSRRNNKVAFCLHPCGFKSHCHIFSVYLKTFPTSWLIGLSLHAKVQLLHKSSDTGCNLKKREFQTWRSFQVSVKTPAVLQCPWELSRLLPVDEQQFCPVGFKYIVCVCLCSVSPVRVWAQLGPLSLGEFSQLAVLNLVLCTENASGWVVAFMQLHHLLKQIKLCASQSKWLLGMNPVYSST